MPADTPAPELNAPKKDYCEPMHTAEHVLNRTMVTMFGCERSFSNHIEAKKSKCDYHFSPEAVPSREQLEAVAVKVNEVLHQNLAVTSRIVTREEAATLCELNRLPDDASEMLRLVYVGDFDICPCIGAHVENTSECGTFVLGNSKYENGVLRIIWKLQR